MNKVYSGYEIELNKEEDKAYKAKILKIEGNSYQETRDEVAGTTVSGDFISISDAQDLPITKFNIEGKSVQETRSGKNKADLSGINKSQISVSYVSNEDGSVKVSGTASADGYIMLKTLAINIPSETYVTMAYGSTKELLKDTDIKAFVWFYDASDNLVGSFSSSTFMMKDKYPTDIVKMTIGVEHMKSGTTYNLDLYIDIEISETIPTEYEQYGASPSIEFKAPVESVGDNIQLFDISTVTTNKFVYADSGELGASTVSITSDYIPVAANETYTALLDYETLAQDGPRGIALYDNDKKYISGVTYTSSKKGFTYTPTQSGYLRFSYDNNCTVVKFSKGTLTGAYSPYGQGSIEIKQVNKNQFKVTATTKTVNGITFTVNEDGTILVNGTSTADTSFLVQELTAYEAGEYILSDEANGSGTTYFTRMYRGSSGYDTIAQTTAGTAKFLLNEDTEFRTYILIKPNTTLNNILFKPMIRLASDTDDTYVPHQSQTKVLYTQQPFGAVGNVKDRFIKKAGVWYEEHPIFRKIFDGTENWLYQDRGNGIYRFNILLDNAINLSGRNQVLSNYFLYKGSSEEEGNCFISDKYIYFYSTISSVNDFKAKLKELYNAGTPLYVDYVLAEPELIPCTPEQVEVLESMRTYEGVNHIYTTDELKPTISLRYNYIPALPSLNAESYTSSVGDNINLFDKDNVKITHKLTQNDNKFVTNTNSNFITINADGGSNAVYENNLKAGDYSISFDIISTKNITLENFYLVTKKSDDTMRNVVVIKSVSLKANEKTRVRGSNKLDSDAIKYGFAGYFKPNFENGTVTISNIKLEKGTKATPYSPYGQGSIEIKQSARNLANYTDEVNSSSIVNFDIGDLVSGKDYTIYIELGGTLSFNLKYKTSDNIIKTNWNAKGTYIYNFTAIETDVLHFNGFGGNGYTGAKVMLLEGTYTTETIPPYEKYQEQTKALYTQQPFRAIGDVKDRFVKQNGVWYEEHSIFRKIFDGTEEVSIMTVSGSIKRYTYQVPDTNNETVNADKVMAISNYFKGTTFNKRQIDNTVYSSSNGSTNILAINTSEVSTTAEFKAKLTELYNAGTPVYVDYVLAEPELIPCTPQQSTILDQLENIQLYDGVNYIHTIDEIQPLLTLEIYNMIEDYDLYVSNDGYFGIPGTDIKFLVNFHESNLPTMPEAVEASVRAAGRDGDYVLNTTYEPLPFEIVCYTEDNLTPTQKNEIESKVNRFLNSIKNRTKRIAFEKEEKFYNVKYNGLLTTTNYPAHLKFSIPLKSSESFGKDAYQKVLLGNSTEVSDTVEEVGALITINGPATLPIIALNDYSMEYDTAILEGARIEIDTAKSTATHINSDGVKTNVMRHYNHQFPKIQPGENTLKVLSGVDDENNVTVKWNDLKL